MKSIVLLGARIEIKAGVRALQSGLPFVHTALFDLQKS